MCGVGSEHGGARSSARGEGLTAVVAQRGHDAVRAQVGKGNCGIASPRDGGRARACSPRLQGEERRQERKGRAEARMCAQMDDGDACRPRAETRAGGDLRGLRGGMERRARRCREGFAGACAQSGHATRLLDAEGARSHSPLVTGHGRADGSSDGRGVGGAAARTRKIGASADPVVHMQSTAWVDIDESRPPSGPGKSAPLY